MQTFVTGVVAVMIAALVGWIVKQYIVPRLAKDGYYKWHLSLREYLFGLGFALVVAIVTIWAGSSLSVASTLRYQEFYNGVETGASRHVTMCQPGQSGNNASAGKSNCRYQYDTGQWYSYTVLVTEYYTCVDSDGDITTCSRLVPETRWASIYYPYGTLEATYSIDDSLGGTYRFPSVYIPADAELFDGEPIPDSVPRGAPAQWQDARDRLDAGDPRPVTRIFGYDNYILAAKDDMLLPFSQDVERYQEARLLPDHTANITTDPMTGFNHASAHKVSFVGVTVADEAAWQEALMGLNAALGSTLRGDLHMVVIDSTLVDSPTTYLNALKAYWAGDAFGRRAIAKNAIIVVVGVEGDAVQWAKASTGMPFGNETMIVGIEDLLQGVEFTPEAVIGNPRTIVTPAVGKDEDDTVQVHLADQPGVLEDVILSKFPFQRACMTCADDGEGVGYGHLVAKVAPKPAHLIIMGLIIVVVSIAFWFHLAMTSYLERTKPDRYEPFHKPQKPVKYNGL